MSFCVFVFGTGSEIPIRRSRSSAKQEDLNPKNAFVVMDAYERKTTRMPIPDKE